MRLEFQEKAFGSKDFVIPVQLFTGSVQAALGDQTRHFGRHTSRGADEAFRMLSQKFVVNPGEIIKTFQLGGAGDLEQIFIPHLIFRQEQQVGGFLILLGVTFTHTARRQISLYPDNGFDAMGDGCVVEVNHAKHGAVVGECQGGHVHFLGALD